MKITTKTYICLACGNTELHATNHEEEIYCRCKKCGNLGLHPESKLNIFDESNDVAVFHYYKFDVNIIEEQNKYYDLCDFLDEKNYKKFRTYYQFNHTELWQQWDNKEIKIINPQQFANQYITNKGRLHQWSEAIWDNKKIKEGYYLDSFGVKQCIL
jgi:DNA-directed RNA polymerase subunit RPC12/RpoP